MAGRRPSYETALERFVRGQCPLCGKGEGEPKGVEKREKMTDMFCHTCRKSWTKLTVLNLKHELPGNGAKHPLELVATVPLVLGSASSLSLFQRLVRGVAALVGK